MLLSRAVRAYSTILDRKPLLGTSVTSAICYGAGDYIAQNIAIKQGKQKELDYHRITVFTLFGLCAGGPIYYLWFSKIHNMEKILETVVRWNKSMVYSREYRRQFNKFIKVNGYNKIDDFHFDRKVLGELEGPLFKSKTILTAQVLADQWIFSSIYPIFFMITTGMILNNTKQEDLEYIKKNKTLNFPKIKQTFNDSIINVKNKWFTIFAADCAIWPQIQMLNFSFVPAHLQAPLVNFVNIFWNAYICYVSQDGGH
jgi:hypothetical protein